MRLGWDFMKLTALVVLVGVLGLSIWTIGCGEPASPVKPIQPAHANGSEAGSTKGGGTDVPPAAEGDSGATKPADAGDKTETPKADADKPADADKKDDPKADEAKKDDEKKE